MPHVRREAGCLVTPQQRAQWAYVEPQRAYVMRRVARKIREPFVEDVAQLVMMRAYILIMENRTTFETARDPRGAVRGWLTLIVRGVVSDWLRTSTTGWIRHGTQLPKSLPGPDPLAALEAREALRQVPRGLTAREVKMLDAIGQGRTLAETGAALGLRPGTVAMAVRTVRIYLRHRRAHRG